MRLACCCLVASLLVEEWSRSEVGLLVAWSRELCR